MATKNVTIIGRVDDRRAGRPQDFLAEVRVEHDYTPPVAVYMDGMEQPLALTVAEARRLSNLLNDAAMEAALKEN